MARTLRLDPSHRDDHRRWLAGVLVSSRCARVTAALVSVSGHGLDARIEIVATAAVKVPLETAAMFAAMASSPSSPLGMLAPFRATMAEVQASAVDELLDRSGVSAHSLLAVGVHDPGLWKLGRKGPVAYLGLCDAARLAETTGLNVIDAFPARDVAQGGLGGPITAIAQWLLLRDPQQCRVLLDLGRTAHLTYLPASGLADPASRILAMDVGPGTQLLDELAQRLSSGEQRFDPGGRLAVQGRRIPELIQHWLKDPYFSQPLPRWHPRGVAPERFLTDALQKAVGASWSVRDLLCSATHLLAETVVLALRTRLPEDVTIDEILVTGGGQHNGMLLREIGRLAGVPLARIGDTALAEGLEPSAVAVLAMLYLDQVPGNATAITNAAVPRLLGRLTPGSPQAWQRLLQSAVERVTPARPLRAAL